MGETAVGDFSALTLPIGVCSSLIRSDWIFVYLVTVFKLPLSMRNVDHFQFKPLLNVKVGHIICSK